MGILVRFLVSGGVGKALKSSSLHPDKVLSRTTSPSIGTHIDPRDRPSSQEAQPFSLGHNQIPLPAVLLRCPRAPHLCQAAQRVILTLPSHEALAASWGFENSHSL
jgi:hypothetical protein